jgi:4-hydroxy-tetrahydrodipicolinate reductase
MKTINVVVHGALGKVGKEVVSALCRDKEARLVGAVDANAKQDFLPLPDGSGQVPFSADLEGIITRVKPDVVVDFSITKATMPAVRIATANKVHLVIGTTGLSQADLAEIDRLAKANGVGAVVASNFALGAVLMMHLAKIAAKYFDYAEIIELHHHLKADAPSGTALSTAREMAKSRGKAFLLPSEKDPTMKSRGEQFEGIPLHSIRLPGLMAHQEVILGTSGQTLIIRHDTINRECYTPGVLLAVKEVVKHQGLISGLAPILGLKD